MTIRITKRNIQFSSDDDQATRSDYATLDTVESKVAGRGTPIPVLFGTRYLQPTVTTWRGLSNNIRYFGFIYSDRVLPFAANLPSGQVPQNSSNSRIIAEIARTDKFTVPIMHIISARMVLCVGKVDEINYWESAGIQFIASPQPLPRSQTFPSGALDEPDPSYAQALDWQDNAEVTRYETGANEFHMFGATSGVGYSIGRQTYTLRTQFSEIWYCKGEGDESPNIPALELLSEQYGVSSLLFNNFNFGGTVPLPKWRVVASRTDYLTNRDSNNMYRRQWYPVKARVGQIRRTETTRKLFLWVLDRTLSSADRRKIRSLLFAIPHTDDSVYVIIQSGYFTITSTTFSSGTTSPFTDRAYVKTSVRATAESTVNSWVSAGGAFRSDRLTSGHSTYYYRGAESITLPASQRFLSHIYVQEMMEITGRSPDAQGIIILTGTDVRGVYGTTSGGAERSTSSTDLFSYMEVLGYPLPRTFSTRGNHLFNESLRSVLIGYKPEIKCLYFRYSGDRTQFKQPSIATEIPASVYEADTAGRPVVLGGTGAVDITALGFLKLLKSNPVLGYSMNPVHALREAITDPEWGVGVAETRIDDESFRKAADVCFDEGLDYCYVHDQLGGVDRLVKSITDYIEGIVFFDAETNQIKLKLIRDDYVFDDLPKFDETTISSVSQYRRQHTNELVNSVTVKYRDASTDSEETVTIHDQEASTKTVGGEGGVVSVTLSFDGCATEQAAVKVAGRELFSLSRPVISLSAQINPSTPLGLGDPIVFSYQDLNLSNIVMRVVRIDYSDGINAGVKVQLIQDVFSSQGLFGPTLYGLEPDVPDHRASLVYLEASAVDLSTARVSNPFTTDTGARYFKVGRRDSVFSGDVYFGDSSTALQVSVGRLNTAILALSTAPDADTQTFSINLPGLPSGFLVQSGIRMRIDQEIFELMLTTQDLLTNTYTFSITDRALDDTVAVAHAIGATVYYLPSMQTQTTPWNGLPVEVNNRYLAVPDINFITRGRLPYPPESVRVNNSYAPVQRIDGDLTILIKPRRATGVGANVQSSVVHVNRGDTLVLERLATVANDNLQTISIPTASIGTGQQDLTVSVFSHEALDGLLSWQSWVFEIDWSATTRGGLDPAPDNTGWGYDYGRDWNN